MTSPNDVLGISPKRLLPCYKPCPKIGWGLMSILSRRVALRHKFQVGESVFFTAGNGTRPAATGRYEIIRLLPTDGDDCQYRIKSSAETFERVAKESQLSV